MLKKSFSTRKAREESLFFCLNKKFLSILRLKESKQTKFFWMLENLKNKKMNYCTKDKISEMFQLPGD